MTGDLESDASLRVTIFKIISDNEQERTMYRGILQWVGIQQQDRRRARKTRQRIIARSHATRKPTGLRNGSRTADEQQGHAHTSSRQYP